MNKLREDYLRDRAFSDWRSAYAEDVDRLAHYNSGLNGTQWIQVKHNPDNTNNNFSAKRRKA